MPTETPPLHFIYALDSAPPAFVCLLLFALAAGAAAAADTDLFTRSFDVPPDFLTSRGALGKSGAQAVLKAAGVSFPEGAAAAFNAATAQIIVKNTQANLALVEAYLNKLSPGRAGPQNAAPGALPMTEALNLTMSVQAYELPKKDPLVAQAQLLAPKADAQALLARVSGLAAHGQAKVWALPVLTGRSGQRSYVMSGNGVLQVMPVFNANLGLLSITGHFSDRGNGNDLAINSDLLFGGTTFVGTLDNSGGQNGVVLVFLKVAAQPAGNAP